MTLIEKIELYRQMSKEFKEVTKDIRCVEYEINDQSIQEVEEAAKHYGKDLDVSLGCLRLALIEHGVFFVCIRSVPCEAIKTIEYKPLQAVA